MYVSRSVKKNVEQRRCRREEGTGLPAGVGWTLHYLMEHENEEVFQKNIETDLHIGKSSLTQMLNVLEQQGMIVREISRKDSRYKSIHITDKAREFHKGIRNDINEVEEQLIKGISQEELKLFSDILERMQENMNEIMDKDNKCPDWMNHHGRHI